MFQHYISAFISCLYSMSIFSFSFHALPIRICSSDPDNLSVCAVQVLKALHSVIIIFCFKSFIFFNFFILFSGFYILYFLFCIKGFIFCIFYSVLRVLYSVSQLYDPLRTLLLSRISGSVFIHSSYLQTGEVFLKHYGGEK